MMNPDPNNQHQALKIISNGGNPKGVRTIDKKKELTDEQFNEAIEMIMSGDTLTKMCLNFEIHRSVLFRQLNSTPERTKRVEEARQHAAETFADKAEEVLINAVGTKEEIARARELSQFYRWRAKAANPKRYGDKVELDGKMELGVKRITGMIVE